MQQASEPIIKDLVLIGGGHSHAIVLRMWGMQPLAGVRLTLITEASDTPYSGMLPGHIAGLYTHQECHINLRSLAQFAQAQLCVDSVIGLDLVNKKVLCANRPPVAFDLLSIDIGSTPASVSVPGAAEYAIAAKPVAKLLTQWQQIVENPQKSISLGIVGGGAGGVELALAMQSNLQQKQVNNLEIHLFHREAEIMPHYGKWVRRRFQEILTQRGIKLHLQETVSEVQANKISCTSGLKVECDRIFWVTQASAPSWIQTSGITTDSQGFIQVNDNLQSISHPDIFAAGDIATMVNHPRPKAGVFAVRQGKPLFNNLRRTLLEQKLQPYKPQKQYLSLIGTGDRKAIAAWGNLGLGASALLWYWKDKIDRQFMQRFSQLPQMQQSPTSPSPHLVTGHWSLVTDSLMRCAGCGSKVGSTVLERVLQRLEKIENNSDIVIGLDAPDDAAVVQIPSGKLMVQTIDYFRALVNDPFTFGQISANHCLSDIFAMGATPHSVLAIASIPYAVESKAEETLYQLLSGALKVLNQAQISLIGGHTTEGSELGFGLSCNGLANPNQLLKKAGMQPEQLLILTKPLGTGTLFAADMRFLAKNCWIDSAIESMLLSNQAAASCLMQYGATACTDITGFGLLGHLIEMVKASDVNVELFIEAIPVLAGAIETMQQGIYSSLQPENSKFSRYIANLEPASNQASYPILFDPQTAGGLLAAIPSTQATACISELQALGYPQARIIGRVTAQLTNQQPVTLN
ncbi:selenide, water dikinase SelD [Aliterella atlantica]|uniref:Segregation protein A n=1 Tax=Aliterella atlantica CENA595 TaxID=1618023 RepID=A0A0D8ZNQ0_9CYAN|nr:selenide, water dikinase SelD [Aliterella atlantica]KJH70114.1 segregation protein A [Aliterella atlantica CENA595]